MLVERKKLFKDISSKRAFASTTPSCGGTLLPTLAAMPLLTFQLQTLKPASRPRSLLLPHPPGGDSLPWLISVCGGGWPALPSGLCSAVPTLFRAQPVTVIPHVWIERRDQG